MLLRRLFTIVRHPTMGQEPGNGTFLTFLSERCSEQFWSGNNSVWDYGRPCAALLSVAGFYALSARFLEGEGFILGSKKVSSLRLYPGCWRVLAVPWI